MTRTATATATRNQPNSLRWAIARRPPPPQTSGTQRRSSQTAMTAWSTARTDSAERTGPPSVASMTATVATVRSARSVRHIRGVLLLASQTNPEAETSHVLTREEGKAPALHYGLFERPNGFELTGAGLTPRCNDDRREAGVRCSEGLDDVVI